jgi:2-polyprenyl-3-methyl-5-hydroxy-6-metoxy-1,4-benzoquinol methylase
MFPGSLRKEADEMAFEALKERQSFVWGNAPFEEVADTIADIHRVIVDALLPAEGMRWLDVACGTGDLAELATQQVQRSWGSTSRRR